MQVSDLKDEELIEIFNCTPGRLFDEFEFYPLSSPGMPPPGPNFLKTAELWTDEQNSAEWWLKYNYFRALYDSECSFRLPVDVGGTNAEPLPIIPGHLWGGMVSGPIVPDSDPKIMIVGKMPTLDDINNKRNFTSDTGQLLRNILSELGLSETTLNNIYVTNAVRWFYRNPKSDKIPDKWIKDCLPLLHQEFRLIKPDIVLCLGTEATKAVLGTKFTLKSMIGQVKEIEIPVYKLDEAPCYHTMKVMAVTNPGILRHKPEQEPTIKVALSQFVELVKGETVTGRLDDIEIQIINDEETLTELVDLILSQPGIKKVGVDLEWDQRYPTEPGAYVRTVQISHTPRYGAVIKLREAGGTPSFTPNIDAAITQLKRIWAHDEVQIGGAHFSADIPWLESLGIPAATQFRVPIDINKLNEGNYAGGFDVAVAEHAHNESGPFGLKDLSVFRCKAEPWDLQVEQWIAEYIKSINIKRKDLPGYGMIPDEILLPYAGYDVAFTRELMDIECELLKSDKYNAPCWRPFHISMLAMPAFLEMHMNGINIDRKRMDALTDLYLEVRADKLQKFREKIKWPEYNPRSFPQTVELLFGEEYNRKMDSNGNYMVIRPKGAISFKLPPVKSTSKQNWDIVVNKREEDRYSPSTDQEVCGILATKNPAVGELRDIKFIDHILKSVLRAPIVSNGNYVLDAFGNRTYDGGIGTAIDYDNRVRSTFSQLKETGRASSARFPLQNLAKRREAAYAAVAGDKYKYPVRSILCARPGYVLMEVDFQSAELFVSGVLARDANLIEHCRRAMLPKSDPDFYDIHSNVAVLAFNLDCEPTPAGLTSIGKIHLRVGAKNVIFGSFYDRGAEAIARQCQEEGIDIVAADALLIKSAIFELYPDVQKFQDEIRERVINPGWLQNPFGRRRRFYYTRDEQVISANQREALNMPPQSTVADSLSMALFNLKTHPARQDVEYHILSQIHDAALLEVPVANVGILYNTIIPECFRDKVSFKACDLDGVPYEGSPDYRFGLETDIYQYWGIKLKKEDYEKIGLDPDFAK